MIKVAFLFFALAMAGCAAYRLPAYDSASTSPAKKIIALAVQPTDTDNFRRHEFEKSMLSTGIVSAITPAEDKTANPVAVLRANDPVRCFSEPMLMIISLGIIPDIGCRDTGYIFELQDRKSGKTVTVDSRYDVKLIWGWAALFFLPFDEWVGEKGLTDFENARLAADLKKAINELESNTKTTE